MKVKVQILGYIPGVNWREKILDVSAENLRELLKQALNDLMETIIDNKTEQPLPFYKILLNNRDVSFLNGLDTKLNDGASITIYSTVGGG